MVQLNLKEKMFHYLYEFYFLIVHIRSRNFQIFVLIKIPPYSQNGTAQYSTVQYLETALSSRINKSVSKKGKLLTLSSISESKTIDICVDQKYEKLALKN